MRVTRRTALAFGALVWTGGGSGARADTLQDRAVCIDAATEAQSLMDARKLLAARERLLVCGRPGCPSAVLKDCISWLRETEESIASLVFVAKLANGADLSEVRVSIDGAPVATHLDGMPLDVDPGSHTVVFQLPDGTTSAQRVLAHVGEKHAMVTATFPLPAVAVAPPTPTDSSMGAGTLAKTAPFAGPPHEPNRARTFVLALGYTTGALGLVGLVVGAAFGLDALAKLGELTCRDHVCTPPETLREGKVAATDSTIVFVAGGALTAVGLVLVITAPPRRAEAMAIRIVPVVQSSRAGAALQIAW